MSRERDGRWSLLRRLVLGFGFSFIVLLLLSNVVFYFMLKQRLHQERDAILRDRRDAIAALLKSPAHGLEELHQRIEREWPKRGGEKVFVEILDGNGRPVSRTPDLPAWIPERFGAFAATPPGDSRNRSLELRGPESEEFLARAWLLENSIGLSSPVLLRITISEQQSHDFLDTLREIMLGAMVLEVVLSLIVGWQIARSGMRPLQLMARTVGRIGSRTLHERVNLSPLPVELYPLAEAFNQTLDRLEDAFGRLSRFSADIAHELRTPISNMTGEIEVALTRSRSEGEYREVLGSNLEECNRLTSMIESMLFLARAENLKHELKPEKVELREEIESLIEFFEPSASEKGVMLESDGSKDAAFDILAERVLFQRALGNVVSNAIRYTSRGGKVRILNERNGSFARITVVDSGSGIPEQHLGRIFERFYRVDPSRSVDSGGFGLGLAIVKSIVELHGGQVVAHSNVGQGTEIIMDWPTDTPFI